MKKILIALIVSFIANAALADREHCTAAIPKPIIQEAFTSVSQYNTKRKDGYLFEKFNLDDVRLISIRQGGCAHYHMNITVSPYAWDASEIAYLEDSIKLLRNISAISEKELKIQIKALERVRSKENFTLGGTISVIDGYSRLKVESVTLDSGVDALKISYNVTL